jgi:hypothetical protein
MHAVTLATSSFPANICDALMRCGVRIARTRIHLGHGVKRSTSLLSNSSLIHHAGKAVDVWICQHILSVARLRMVETTLFPHVLMMWPSMRVIVPLPFQILSSYVTRDKWCITRENFPVHLRNKYGLFL